MDNFINLNIQFTLSLILFIIIFRWYISPKLSQLTLQKALIPLILIHALRYTPLTLLVVGQASSDLPTEVVEGIAYGDFIVSILAFITVFFLKFNWKGAIIVAWIFNIVGFIDIINAFRLGIGAEFFNYFLGGGWYVLNYYTPVLIVTHIYMFYRLFKSSKE